MEITAAFKFRKLKDNEKIKMGDFVSTDDGMTLNPINSNGYINLYPADFLYVKTNESFWRIVNREW